MKDDLGAPHRRPSHRLGIAPALVANRHAKLDPVDLEESPGISGHIELIFGRVELVLGLVSLDLAAGVEHVGGDLTARIRHPFHPHDRRHRVLARQRRDRVERPCLRRPIEGEDVEILSPQTWEVGFRETHDLRALGRRVR